MKEPESEVDSLNGDISMALFALAGYINVVQGKMFEFFEGPGSEHKPGNDGIYKQKECICDTCCHAAFEYTALVADGRAGRCPTARSTEAHELFRLSDRRLPNLGTGHTVPILGTASSGRDKRAPMTLEY